MIHGPHLDRLLTPIAAEPAGVPLSAFGVAAETEDVGLRLAIDGGRGAGGENFQFPAVKVDGVALRARRIEFFLTGEEHEKACAAADHPEDNIGAAIEEQPAIRFG